MEEQNFWDIFYETGKVFDYLQYACTSEESQTGEMNCRKEHKDARDCDGNGSQCVSHWRI